MEHLAGQYFINSDLRADEIRQQIRELCQAGYEIIYLHARAGMKTPYLAKEWFDGLQIAIDELIRCGVKFAIWDEDNYPSGDAGNRICNSYPELAASYLNFHIIEAKAGVRITEFFSENGAFAGCHAVYDDGTLGDLAEHCGSLRRNWGKSRMQSEAYSLAAQPAYPHRRRGMDMARLALAWTPDRDCRIVCSEWIHNGPGWHSSDLLNPATAEILLDLTHKAYEKRFGEQMKHCAASFMDEPCAVGDFPWTRRFPEEFRHDHGYDLMDFLPHLPLNIDGRSIRIRSDYRKTLHRLLCQNYLGTFQKYLSERNIANTGHLSRTEYLTYVGLHWPNELRCLKMLDIPCGDPLGAGIGQPGSAAYHVGLKTVSSAARLFGKKAAGADAFAVGGDTISLSDLKFMLNYHLVMGLNWFNVHGLYYTLEGERRDEAPPSLFYQHSQWPHMKTFLAYLKQRCRELTGEHVCQIEMLYPATTLQVRLPEEKGIDEALHLTAEDLVSRQRDFELIDEVTLLEHDPEKFAALRPYFVVAHAAFIERTTAQWLERYAAVGGTVFVTGAVPVIISEYDRDTAQTWSFGAGCRCADYIDKIPAPVLCGEGADNVLLRRIRKDGNIRTFLFNRSSETFMGTLDGTALEIAPGEGGFADELTAVKKAPQLSVENWTLEFGLNSIPLYYWEHTTLSAVDLISNCHTGITDVPEEGSYYTIFTCEKSPGKVLFTTEEDALERGSFVLNGVELKDFVKADFRDCREVECDISSLLKQGRNKLVFNGKLLENPPYLRGVFKGVFPLGNYGYPVLSPAPEVFALPYPQDFRNLGYGTYSGQVVYNGRFAVPETGRYAFDLKIVKDSVKILIDGIEQTTLIAPPYRFEAEFSAGTHTICLELCNAPGNRDILAGVPAGLQG